MKSREMPNPFRTPEPSKPIPQCTCTTCQPLDTATPEAGK